MRANDEVMKADVSKQQHIKLMSCFGIEVAVQLLLTDRAFLLEQNNSG